MIKQSAFYILSAIIFLLAVSSSCERPGGDSADVGPERYFVGGCSGHLGDTNQTLEPHAIEEPAVPPNSAQRCLLSGCRVPIAPARGSSIPANIGVAAYSEEETTSVKANPHTRRCSSGDDCGVNTGGHNFDSVSLLTLADPTGKDRLPSSFRATGRLLQRSKRCTRYIRGSFSGHIRTNGCHVIITGSFDGSIGINGGSATVLGTNSGRFYRA